MNFFSILIDLFWDIADTGDSFFISENTGIYRKDLDTDSPTLFCEIESNGGCFGRQLKSAMHGRALVINMRMDSIRVLELDPENKFIPKKDLIVYRFYNSDNQEAQTKENEILDFVVMGADQDIVTFMTSKGVIKSYQFSFEDETSKCVAEVNLKHMRQRKEMYLSLNVCSESEYLTILTRNDITKQASRVMVLNFTGEKKLVLKTCIDIQNQQLDYLCTSGFVDYYDHIEGDKRFLVLATFTKKDGDGCYLVSFAYDTVDNRLFELRGLRRYLKADTPQKLSRVGGMGNTFCASDLAGRVFWISYAMS